MNIPNKMWFFAVVLVVGLVAHSDARRPRRMVGGTLAPHVPWQAMVYLSDSVMDGGFAGGALISDRWVLTAGRNLFVRKTRLHTRGKSPIVPKVYLGVSHRHEANESTEVLVQKVVLHPGFQNQSDWDNDLALIQLQTPVALGDRVTPIPLPERDQGLGLDTEGGTGVLAGWGWGALLTSAQSIKHLVLPLANHQACKAAYEANKDRPSVDDNMFCTRATKYTENVCFGDAGGALAVRDGEDVYAAGILSFDKACTDETFAVYTKVSAYLPWINSVLRGDGEGSVALRSAVMSEMYSRQP